MPEKTVESNRLKTTCFDKTGTLTKNELSFKGFHYIRKNKIELIDLTKSQPETNFLKIIFGTCHSVRKIGGVDCGDEVDLRLWEASNFQFV